MEGAEQVIVLDPERQGHLDAFKDRWLAGELALEENRCGCADPDPTQLAPFDRYGLPIETYLCQSCGLVYSTPRMTDDELSQFYKITYRPLYSGQERAPDKLFDRQAKTGREVLQRIRSLLPSGSFRGVVVDIGCGAGGALWPFEEEGWQTIGYDFDLDYLDYGRGRGLDLREGTDEIERCHVLMALHVLEHVATPGAMLARWTSALEPGGLLVISVPGLLRAFAEYAGLQPYLHVAHLFHYTLDSLADLVERSTGLHLLSGDESVFAVFGKGQASARIPTDVSGRILGYLKFRESGMGKVLTYAERKALKLQRRLGIRLDT